MHDVSSEAGSTAVDGVFPFEISVPEEAIVDLHDRLDRARLPEAATAPGFDQGTPLDRTIELVDYWRNTYDWRRFEQKVNAYPQFITEIDGLDFHFLHVRSRHEDALPIIMTHGWPGSFVEFLETIEPLTDPERHGGTAADAFHVVIPSLPGYGFSGKPAETGWNPERTARAWDVLMKRLGYTHYVAQGGDSGAAVTTFMGSHQPEGLAGIHVNLPLLLSPPPLLEVVTPEEQEVIDKLTIYWTTGSGYLAIQTTRPQTIGYGLADSAVGQATWMYEKIAAWSDTSLTPEDVIGWDRILDNISLYWLTNSGTSAARMYHEAGKIDAWATQKLDIPIGISIFPEEAYCPPREWAERAYSNLVYFNSDLPIGGHFAAFEQPTLFVEELRACFTGEAWRAPLSTGS